MVTEQRKSRRERKHAALRAHLVRTAIDLFARHGFANVTVDHIADVADIGKGTVYNYFQTKEDIVVAYMVQVENKVQARIPDFIAARKSVDSILAEFLRFQFRLKRPYRQFVRVFLAQMLTRADEFMPYLIEMQKAIDPPLQKLFEGLQQRKLLRTDLDIPALLTIFKSMHMGLAVLWAIEGPPFRETDRVLKQEMRLFCEGIKEKSS